MAKRGLFFICQNVNFVIAMAKFSLEEVVSDKELPQGKWLVCISGGADSMALLHACVLTGRDVVAVHCNFHLRGAESIRDEMFVRDICSRLGVKLFVKDIDARAYADKHAMSLEMACRETRYDWFGMMLREQGCVRMVVAHNRDDNDETVLLNLFRGTGPRGLAGMRADTGIVLRPLLSVTRAEIEGYLSKIGESFIVDSSNKESDFRRNYIRNELLPAIRSRWSGVGKALEQTRQNMRQADIALSALISKYTQNPLHLMAKAFGVPGCQSLVAEFMRPYSASPTQISDIAKGLRPGKQWQLDGAVAYMDADGLHIEKCRRTGTLSLGGEEFILTSEELQRIKSDRSEQTLVTSLSPAALSVRLPLPGDRILPMGMKGSKLVSDVLHEAGVPLPARGKIPLVVDDAGRVVWIPGIRRSRLYPATVGERSYKIRGCTLADTATKSNL